MVLWEQPWIWQIVVPIIGAVAGSALFYYLSHREKVEIKYPNMVVQLLETNGTTTVIKMECTFALLYSKGTRDCYVSETWLELNRRLWKRLRPYFEVPLKMGGIPTPDGLVKLELGKPQWLAIDWSFPARRMITEEERKELDDLIQKLWYQYEIGWGDTYGKTQRKSIHQLREIQKILKR